MKLIGITGGIGAGKSEIIKYIKELLGSGCQVYLADEVAHLVQAPGEGAYEKIVALLGRDILLRDGEIDKAKMAQKIFSNGDLLEEVNAIVHPAVMDFLLDRIEEAKKEGISFFFIEAALLIECGYCEILDELWYIYADEAIRRKRLKESRGYSDAKIDAILKAQNTEAIFRDAAQVVIDNSGSLEVAYMQVKQSLTRGDGHADV